MTTPESIVPTIRTARLVMRPWVPEDLAPFAALCADPVVMEHFQGLMTFDQCEEFIRRVDACWSDRGWGLWAIEVPGVAPFIGYVGLWPADHVCDRPAEVGWRLAKEHWGNGYAPEAAAEALRLWFDEIGAPEIYSFTVTQNHNSRRVMDKIGLRHDPGGDFDHPLVDPALHPDLVRHVLYRLTADEWRAAVSGEPPHFPSM